MTTLPGDVPQVVGPSGVYGFREVEPMSWEGGRVVQVVESTNHKQWIATPARYYARDIAQGIEGLAIDYGMGWHLPAEDVRPLVEFARAVLGDEACVHCGQPLVDHDRHDEARCRNEHVERLLGL